MVQSLVMQFEKNKYNAMVTDRIEYYVTDNPVADNQHKFFYYNWCFLSNTLLFNILIKFLVN